MKRLLIAVEYKAISEIEKPKEALAVVLASSPFIEVRWFVKIFRSCVPFDAASFNSSSVSPITCTCQELRKEEKAYLQKSIESGKTPAYPWTRGGSTSSFPCSWAPVLDDFPAGSRAC